MSSRSRVAASVLALLAGAAQASQASQSPRGALAAALLCQTSYRLDDELAADEAAGERDYPRALARLRELLGESFGAEASRAAALFRAPRLDLLAFGVEVPGLAVVVFRGSRGPREAEPGRVTNWWLNRLAEPRPYVVGFPGVSVHPGYAHATRALLPAVRTWLRGRSAERVVFTGHSLGAAMASYAAFAMAGGDGAPGALVTFGAPGVDYAGCGPGAPLAEAFRARAPSWTSSTYAFEDDAAPWLLRAVCRGSRPLGEFVDLGPSPTARPPVGPGDVTPGDPERAASARVGAASKRWMHLDTHYAFHYVRALARRWAAAEGLAFDADRYREFYGLPRPLDLR
jgi:hypothetical protein